MPFHARGRRALFALAALAAGLVVASPAVAVFPAPAITPDAGSPANGAHTTNKNPSFTITTDVNPGDGNPYPFDWCFVPTGSAVNCSSPQGTSSPATASLPDGGWTLIAESPDSSDNSV